jgi:hypothetical protein
MTAGLPEMCVAFRTRAILSFAAVGMATVTLTLSGCGSDDSGDVNAGAAQPTSSSSVANRPPTITGSPRSSVMHGTAYTFAPSAVDPDGDTLTFTVSNKPEWATFNANTGQLRGVPTAADVGTTSNVVISVSDGTAIASLASFDVQVVATAIGSATLTWNPPTHNTDGTPLTDLAGYKVYWGTAQGSYPNSVTLNNPGLSTYVVEQLTPATWYFVLSAVNSAGVESAYSNAGLKRIL